MKKSNLQIVKDYVDGIRPVIQIGYEPKQETHEIGEMWTDVHGETWEQRKGYKLKFNPQAAEIRRLTKSVCKKCGKEVKWGTRLDEKLYKYTSHCFDCQIEEETKMRMEGTFKLYEKKKVLFNQLSYLEEIADKIRDQYNKVPADKISFQNVVNDKLVDSEKWSDINKDDLKKSLRKDYRMVYAEILKIKKKLKNIE